ncbi:MAG: class I SAM-dependent methyltransferase [Ruminococcus sp.]|nr:class I SAM-dependent methyltransferase [Ruminococcus sp.]
MNVISHYDNLIRENNDPFRDPPPLKDYMDKWDGQLFIELMGLSCDKRVLEIGIGTGRIATKVAPLCMKLCGIDISPKTIERATENLAGYNNVQLICADFTEYGFDQTFDVIYSSLTMLHFEDKQNVIHKVDKLLERNGVFCLSIDKNTDNHIDMGSYKLRVFPDNVDDIKRFIGLTDMSIANQYETEFAHIFLCTK